jgi:inosine/xanthosine triphosphate pyrophosphatase family protein
MKNTWHTVGSMNVVLSTRNPSKAEQIKAIFTGLPVIILTLSEAGITGEGVEDGSTIYEYGLLLYVFF